MTDETKFTKAAYFLIDIALFPIEVISKVKSKIIRWLMIFPALFATLLLMGILATPIVVLIFLTIIEDIVYID